MNQAEIDKVLSDTLADHRVSRSEKSALKSLASELHTDDKLAFVLHRAFELARRETIDPHSTATIQWLEDVVKIFRKNPGDASAPANSEAMFSPQDDCSSRIQALIQTARTHLDICVFTITDDSISGAILDAHRRKIDIRIISDNDKANDRGSDIDELRQRGIPLVIDQTEYHMHHKYALFDRTRLLTGSYNWTIGAARYNEENFVITEDEKLVDLYQRHFNELWKSLS